MTAQYHDALDRFEAKERAMRAEATPEREPECTCCDPVHPGADDNCPIHGLAARIQCKMDEEHDAELHDSRERDRDIADLRGGL